VLSKFTSTEYAEAFGPSPNVVFSWSLSLPTISRDYEKKVAPLERRLNKAAEMKAAGYRIRFRLDALAPIPDWEKELDEVMARINDIQPEMLTIGALRATNPAALRRAAENNGRDGSIFDYIKSIDPSRFKHRTDDLFHVSAFQRIAQRLSPTIALGLCKEDVSMWRQVGVKWNGCHCLHGRQDEVAADRIRMLRFKSTPRQDKPLIRVLA
jgi:hypothetical protein